MISLIKKPKKIEQIERIIKEIIVGAADSWEFTRVKRKPCGLEIKQAFNNLIL